MSLPDFDRHIDYASYYGQYVQKAKIAGDQLVGLCPLHPEKNPSFSANLKTGQWICRSSCGSGNVINFHARLHNMTPQEAVEELKKKYLPPDSSAPKSARKTLSIKTLEELSPLPEQALEYLTTKRGWSREVIEKYGIKYHDKGRRKAVAIPVYSEGALVNIRTYAPETANKILSWGKGLGEARLYPEEVIERARAAGQPVILCEGEPDALCGISRGLYCVTQTAGAETWKDHFNAKFKGLEVIICYDHDDAGRKGAERVARHLPHFARSVSMIQWPEFMREKEDLTDWFVKYGKSVEELMALERKPCTPSKSEGNQSKSFLPEDIATELQALNEKHAVIMIGGKCLIMNHEHDPTFNRPTITFSAVEDFRKWYANKRCWMANGNGKAKQYDLSEIWLKSQERPQYRGVVFAPGEFHPEYYNLYRGLSIEPQKGDWSLMQEHLYENISRKNMEVYKYLLSWMAQMVQQPGGERPGISIVMRGDQGVGKGVFAKYFGTIFGPHYMHITQAGQLTGRFNAHTKDVLLCFVDEALWAGDKAAEGVLKALVTEDYLMVEPKNKDPFPIKNHMRIIIASNNDWVVPAAIHERRFFVIDVGATKIQDSKYFKAISRERKNGGQAAMLYDLLDLNISNVDLRKFPKTEALFDQQMQTANTAIKFWFHRLSNGNLKDSDGSWVNFSPIPTRDLYSSYVDYCRMLNERYPLISSHFVKKIRSVCPEIHGSRPSENGERIQCLNIPDLHVCRTLFEKAFNQKVEWDTS
jgi:hypothetical protein